MVGKSMVAAAAHSCGDGALITSGQIRRWSRVMMLIGFLFQLVFSSGPATHRTMPYTLGTDIPNLANLI